MRSTKEAVARVERAGQLLRIKEEVDPRLVMAAMQRRVGEKQGPALYFECVKGSPFPAVSNLFGTLDRLRLLFAEGLDPLQRLLALKADEGALMRRPWKALPLLGAALQALPRKISAGRAPVLSGRCRLSDLPQIVSWPMDGGPFVTLPQVYSEDPRKPGVMNSNLGMYRVQLGGNDYEPEREIGLHYQIHRGIGVHHEAHLAQSKPFRVAVFVGGPPSLTFAAVMPLPEGMPEVAFAGVLGSSAYRYTQWQGHHVSADADFAIVGTIRPGVLKPEGPFGDHLGYYSLRHQYPVLEVEQVFHRPDAVWPFTVVGRPPQEDSAIGAFIHELTGPLLPTQIKGLVGVHAVDASGVHPLLFAEARERYLPYLPTAEPMETLTVASAVLGTGQLSLAKYLFIGSGDDVPDLHHEREFIDWMLRRIDPQRDLHFITRTTMDTLDYSSGQINRGSKLVLAACGAPLRDLSADLRDWSPPAPWRAAVIAPGIVALSGPAWSSAESAAAEAGKLAQSLAGSGTGMVLAVLCDDAVWMASDYGNFLWAAFTRSDPAQDIHGHREQVRDKHWGAELPLIMDARKKPHHAPALEVDPAAEEQAEAILRRHGWGG